MSVDFLLDALRAYKDDDAIVWIVLTEQAGQRAAYFRSPVHHAHDNCYRGRLAHTPLLAVSSSGSTSPQETARGADNVADGAGRACRPCGRDASSANFRKVS